MRYFIAILLLVVLFSCGRDDEKSVINDFSKPHSITLKPYKKYPYSMMNIWVKGYVNDTILVKLNSKNGIPIMRLSGHIDKRWHTDYYGEGPITIIFDPYKATKGELEIDASL